ncbi:DivIVA domain-containing protein [Streptomyces sp. ICBB 8177]|uniref:DivIVA domain-containing protein n=1 Tax=Streptomyces sp. ICBB 8177 TaxID=563922 RepID=UPI001F54076B|nr:DivIVA domain-containing protein [Streptomyces sp. ICBB 8177]
MFWFMLIALVAVVAAVALAVVGDGGTLPEAEPDRLRDPLPADRPLKAADLEELRLAVSPRGYRMSDVDDVLDRLGAELAERDARIAQLEAALASGPGPGGHAAHGGPAGHVPPPPGHGPGFGGDAGRPGTGHEWRPQGGDPSGE